MQKRSPWPPIEASGGPPVCLLGLQPSKSSRSSASCAGRPTLCHLICLLPLKTVGPSKDNGLPRPATSATAHRRPLTFPGHKRLKRPPMRESFPCSNRRALLSRTGPLCAGSLQKTQASSPPLGLEQPATWSLLVQLKTASPKAPKMPES